MGRAAMFWAVSAKKSSSTPYDIVRAKQVEVAKVPDIVLFGLYGLRGGTSSMAAPVGGIAVVGAGPGGLLAAIHLAKTGEKVTVCVAHPFVLDWRRSA